MGYPYICYTTKILLRYILILSKNTSKGSFTSEANKNADFGEFVGKEGVIFFNENLQGPYKHVFK
jgi:hypothetical protein